MNRGRGFSLVEMMIAITLALVVTTGVLSVFIGSRSAFQATSGIAALSDNGRFALNFIENAVRDSGNMACGAATRTINNLNPEATSLYYAPGLATGLFQPLGGFEAANTSVGNTYTASTGAGALGNWNPALDGAFGSLATLPVKNNDILVVRSSSQGSQPSYVTAITDGANNFTVNAQGSLQAGQLAIISDCVKSLLIQITGIGPGAPGKVISHLAAGSPGNITAAFPAQYSFAQGAQVTPLATTVYYIGVGSDGDGALFSADVTAANTLTANELVPDIEAMQVLYGLDTNNSLTVSEYVTADQVVDFTTIMSIQVAVLAAGPPGSANKPAVARQFSLFGTTVTAPRDTRARQVFEVTIAARNALH